MNRRGAQGVDMVKVMENPRYRGKHIIVMGGEVYTATSGENARKRLRQLEKKYPNQKTTHWTNPHKVYK